MRRPYVAPPLRPPTRISRPNCRSAGTRPATEKLLWEISARYLPAEKVPGYVEFAKAELGEQIIYSMRPERWLSADLGAG
jgi:hypothetical protein